MKTFKSRYIALVFLDFNGIQIDDPEDILYNVMIEVASGEAKKDYLAEVFEKLTLKEVKYD